MKTNHFIIICLLSLLALSTSTETEHSYIEDPQSLEDYISNCMTWINQNNIQMNSNYKLRISSNKESPFKSYTKASFISESIIKENEQILSIPLSLGITLDNIESFISEDMKNNFNMLKNTTFYLFQNPYRKEKFFLALNYFLAIKNKSTLLYTKYKPYFDLMEQITDTSSSPFSLKDREVLPIQHTILGKDILSNKKFFIDEVEYVRQNFTIDSIKLNEYISNRVSTQTKFDYLNQKTTILPILDLFIKRNEKSSNAYYTIEGDFVVIKASREIKEGEFIIIKTKTVSNSLLYLFNGYIEENNEKMGPTTINVYHREYKREMKHLTLPDCFIDLSLDTYMKDADTCYRQVFEGILNLEGKIAGYMVRNLAFYSWDYDDAFNLDMTTIVSNEEHRNIILSILKQERNLIMNRMEGYGRKYGIRSLPKREKKEDFEETMGFQRVTLVEKEFNMENYEKEMKEGEKEKQQEKKVDTNEGDL